MKIYCVAKFKISTSFEYLYFLILHFFVGAVIFPFNMIHAKARKVDSQNPQDAANGYQNSDNSTFFGYEEIN